MTPREDLQAALAADAAFAAAQQTKTTADAAWINDLKPGPLADTTTNPITVYTLNPDGASYTVTTIASLDGTPAPPAPAPAGNPPGTASAKLPPLVHPQAPAPK